MEIYEGMRRILFPRDFGRKERLRRYEVAERMALDGKTPEQIRKELSITEVDDLEPVWH